MIEKGIESYNYITRLAFTLCTMHEIAMSINTETLLFLMFSLSSVIIRYIGVDAVSTRTDIFEL